MKKGVDDLVIYADILFCTNFFMDYLIISACSAIIQGKTRRIRKILASILGGIYGVCMFVPNIGFAYSGLAAFFFSAAVAAVVMCPCSIKIFLKYLFAFYITSFILAGSLYMILPITGGGMIKNNIIYYNGMYVAVFAVLTVFLLKKRIEYVKAHAKKYTVKIKYKDRSIKTTGILDTGNLLKDPVNGKPIVVGDESILKKLFSENCGTFNINEWVQSTDIRIIPYKTLDKEGVMTGFVADEIKINNEIMKNIVIGISPKKLEHGVLLNIANI